MNKYISFLCKGQYFALHIDCIEKIILHEDPIIVPETSDYILGYVSYDGAPLPIIDLNQRFFDLKTKVDELSKVIVVHWQECRLGLLVDEVSTVEDYEVDENAGNTNNSDESYIVNTIYHEDKIILELSLDHLFVEKAQAELHRLL